MQCPGCRARLPMNLEFAQCPRCGRALGKAAALAPPPEVSSPSLNFDLGRGFWKPARLLEGVLDAVELVFSPRTAWEAWLRDPHPFLGRRSPPGYAALVLAALGALLTTLAMVFQGQQSGEVPYVITRTWSAVMLALVPPGFVVAGFVALGVVRRVAMALLPGGEDVRAARMNASRVAILAGAPALASNVVVVLWVVPELGPLLATAGVLYCLRATLEGLWRGPGMMLDLDAATRTRLLTRLALPGTLLLAAAGGGGLLALVALYP